MGQIFSALAPVFLLILLGYLIRWRALIADSFWVSAEKMTYFLFFPALLLSNTAKADFGSLDLAPMIAAAVIAVLLVAGLAGLLRPRLNLSGPSYTSVFQAFMRPNVYLGIAAAYALYGEAGLTLVSVCVAVLVPLVNVLGVLVLVRHAGTGDTTAGWKQAIGPVARNPLIIACGLGTALNVSGLGLPPLAGPFLEILGRAALPVGLLAVGAGLDLAALKTSGRLVGLTSVVKLIVLPGLTYAACLGFGVSGLAVTISVLYASLPNSATSYVLARQMGGDTTLLAGSITASTLLAMLTMPLIAVLLP